MLKKRGGGRRVTRKKRKTVTSSPVPVPALSPSRPLRHMTKYEVRPRLVLGPRSIWPILSTLPISHVCLAPQFRKVVFYCAPPPPPLPPVPPCLPCWPGLLSVLVPEAYKSLHQLPRVPRHPFFSALLAAQVQTLLCAVGSELQLLITK